MAARTSAVRIRPSLSVSINSSIRRSKRTPSVGIEIAIQRFLSSSDKCTRSSPDLSFTWRIRPVPNHCHLNFVAIPSFSIQFFRITFHSE